MVVRKTFVALVAGTCLAFLVQPATADFSYPDFTSTAGLSLNGAASAPGGGVVLVNPESVDVRGSIYHTTRQDIAGSGGFTTTFDYTITNTGGTPGDGMAFIIQDNSPTFVTTAGGGSGMGFQGVNPGVLAIEFDTFYDIGFTGVRASGSYASALSPNSAGGPLIGGAGPSTFAPGGATSPGLADGAAHTAVIAYDGVNKLLDLKIDGSSPWGGTVAVDLTPYLAGDGMAYVGFSGGTGGADEEHKLNSWTFSETGAPLPPPLPPSFNVQVMNVVDGGGSNDHDFNNTNEVKPLWDFLDANPGFTGTTPSLGGKIWNVQNNVPDTEFQVDYGGGGGNFPSTMNYNTINNDGPGGGPGPIGGGDDFSVKAHAFVEIPQGDWSIMAASDDGRYLRLDDVTFNGQGGQINLGGTGNNFIGFNDPTGHNNTVGTFSIGAGGLQTELYAFFWQRGGGDSFEIAIKQGLDTSMGGPGDGWALLTNGLLGWRVSPEPLIIPEPSTILVWSLLAALGIGCGWRRRKR